MKRKMISVLVVAGLILGLAVIPAQAGPAGSVNVALIGGAQFNFTAGGQLITSGFPGGSTFNFTNMAVSQVSLTNLAPYDTAVLNMASLSTSGGCACDSTNLTAQAKADLNQFVSNGGKLIIFDSECPTGVDYSWLVYPFTTNNPGAMGASGTLNIVEENCLSTSASGSTHYIDAVNLGSLTDAVGDMNVMVTLDPSWCLDMSGTNYNNVTGPTHTYARYGSGLIIYNGLDQDYQGFEPQPPDPYGLTRIWEQELKVPFNPTPLTCLPCGVSVTGLSLVPLSATNNVGVSHTLTATVTDLLGNGVPGIPVNFAITAGPNVGLAHGPVNTDANGQATWTYTSASSGTDTIVATATRLDGTQLTSLPAAKTWISPNQPPVADAGPDQTVEQTSHGGALVTLDGSGSTDDGLLSPLTYSWSWAGGSATGVNPTISLPLGTTTVTLTVNDGEFDDTDTVDITVEDTTDPVLTVPNDVEVEQETTAGTVVPLEATATDICDADVDITSDELAIYPLGTTTVTFTATDDSGNSATDSMTVTVVDTTAPVVECVESVNPHGNNVPGENRSKNDKDKRNINPDGFYELSATDICDAEPDLWIGTVDDPYLFKLDTVDGSVVVKFTEAPGAVPSCKKIGSSNGQAGAVSFHITLPSDPVVTAVDLAGNVTSCTCLVPPPPM